MLRNFWVILIGIVAGSVATLLLTKTDQEQNNTQQRLPSKLSVISTEPMTELTQLREENIKLKNKIEEQLSEKLLQQNSNQQSTSNTTTSSNCDSQISKLMAFFAEKDNILAEAKNIKNTSQYDEKIHGDFDTEEKNETWSSATENKFLTEFANNVATRDIVVSSINCRSSTCEIKIPVANMETKNKVMETLSNPSFIKSLGFDNSSIKSGLQIVSGEMTLYISNKN